MPCLLLEYIPNTPQKRIENFVKGIKRSIIMHSFNCDVHSIPRMGCYGDPERTIQSG